MLRLLCLSRIRWRNRKRNGPNLDNSYFVYIQDTCTSISVIPSTPAAVLSGMSLAPLLVKFELLLSPSAGRQYTWLGPLLFGDIGLFPK